MTDDQIETQLKGLIRIERKNTNEILKLINLAESRDLALKRGFSSTFDWLTTGLGYSSSAANRRIQSARLIQTVPEAEQKLEAGEVNLTTLTKARSAIRASEKVSGQKMNDERQAEIIDAISNQTSDQVDATLLNLLSETASTVHQERAKQITEDLTRLTLNLTKGDMELLAWAKDYLSHAVPDGALGQVIATVLVEFKKMKEAKDTLKAQRSSCEFTDQKTGRTCGSTFQVESDHIVPAALGGSDDPSNRRCLCRRHNQMMARYWLGKKWAGAWRKKRAFTGDRDRPDEESA